MANDSIKSLPADLYEELMHCGEIAERYLCDRTEIEFTVENGQLFVCGVRKGKTSPIACIRVALQLMTEGIISPEDVLTRIKPEDVGALLCPEIVDGDRLKLLGRGQGVWTGAASGRIAFSPASVARFVSAGTSVILVVREFSYKEHGDAAKASTGVLSLVGGISSHAALFCRPLGKPCVVGFWQGILPHGNPPNLTSNTVPLKEGQWLTIDAMTGDVFAGRARVATNPWASHPELVQLSTIVESAVASGQVPPTCVGSVWRMWDSFKHKVPLRNHYTQTAMGKKCRRRISLPRLGNAKAIRHSLVRLESGTKENYDEVIRGLVAAVEKELRLAIGSERSTVYCRALWEPVVYDRPSGSTQLVGFEFFDINRHVHHLINISHIQWRIECDVPSPSEAWFFERVGRSRVRIILGAGTITACQIMVNGALLAHEDIPNFYTWLRRRKYFWHWFEENGTSHAEISAFLKRFQRTGATDKRLAMLCTELGLLRRGSLTTSGMSLVGMRHKTRGWRVS
jgi:phosphohistidine swiveling domain-containing protein